MDHADRLTMAETITAACAEVALGYFRARGSLAVESKGPRDFVSEADRQTENAARRLLAQYCPGEVLIGEEYGGSAEGDYWLIDPIDGTTNFLNGLPLWAVSLAYVSHGEPIIGVIALPALGECLSAAQGLGLRGADTAGPDFSLAGIGRNGLWPAAERFALEQHLEAEGISTLCLGSCATSLAMVATNRLTGYAERMVKPWDVAAGLVLCSEAEKAVDVARHGALMDIIAGSPRFVETCLVDLATGPADRSGISRPAKRPKARFPVL